VRFFNTEGIYVTDRLFIIFTKPNRPLGRRTQ
jgi:hypothetical protein